jgi:predicted DNA binding CopG/RHH family protein
MSAKKVNFGKKPEVREPVDVEQWVSDRSSVVSQPLQEQPEKMKRLTLDIPESLHKAIKRQAVDAGVTMADLLRDLLEQHYGNEK